MGDLPGLEVHQRLEHLELGRVLAEVGAEADLAQLVAVEAVAADEDRDLARPLAPRVAIIQAAVRPTLRLLRPT